jgi:hypothetical protein
MADTKERILADAKLRRPQYADRMRVIGPQKQGLPAGLEHYGIRISKLHDYAPINYIVKDNEYYSSMQNGDFSRLLQKLRLMEDDQLSASQLTSLFTLIESPFIQRHLVNKLADLAFSPMALLRERLQLNHKINPPSKQIVNGILECVFYTFNVRAQTLERFLFSVTPDYLIAFEVNVIANFQESSAGDCDAALLM